MDHGIDDGRVHPESLQAAKDVVLAESQASSVLVLQLFQFFHVFVPELSHWLQPNIEKTESGIAEGGVDTTAASVAADENVLDLEVGNSKLDDGEGVDVGSGDNVGNVAVHKDLTGLQAQDGRFGNSRIRTTNPQDLGRLALGGSLEEVGLFGRSVGAPLAYTLGESMGKALCRPNC